MSGEDAQAYKPDIADLLKAVNGASAAARNAWLGFIALMAYLAVTLAGIGHKDLLLDAPTLLPFVNVKIPLTSFFLIAPLVLLFFHFGLLIQHAMLFEKLIDFKTALKAQGLERLNKAETPSVYSEVHSYFFTQSIVGGAKKRRLALAFRFMTMLTLVIVPFALFFYFQVKFLPFHRQDFTWAHRIYLLADLFLLWKIGDYLRHVRCQDVIVSPSPLRATFTRNYKFAKGRAKRSWNKGASSLNRGLAKRRIELRQWVRERLSFAKADQSPETNAKPVYNQSSAQKIAAGFVSFFTKPVFWERFATGLQAGFQGLKKVVGGLFYSLWQFTRWGAGQISFLRCIMGGIVVLSLLVATVPDGFVDKEMNEFATQADRKLYKVAKGVKRAWDWVLMRPATDKKEEGEQTVGLMTKVPIYCNKERDNKQRSRPVFTPTAWLFERKIVQTNINEEIEFRTKRIQSFKDRKISLQERLKDEFVKSQDGIKERINEELAGLSLNIFELEQEQEKQKKFVTATAYCTILNVMTTPRHLTIVNEDLVPDKQDVKEVSHSLRGRDFNYARFDGTDLKRVDLRGAQLKNASFIESILSDAKIKNTTFEGAVLRKAKFERVDFEDSFFVGADLRGVDLSTVKNLHKADLNKVNFAGVDLHKFVFQKANLSGANFSNAILKEADFSKANLVGTDFSNSILSGASFFEAGIYGADFSKATIIEANFSKAYLDGANFSRSNLNGAIFKLANLDGVSFKKASLVGSDLAFAKLAGANLEGAMLRGSDLKLTHLYGANLQGAHLEGANLYWSGLAGVNLSSAQLNGADLSRAVIQGSQLNGTILDYVDLSKAKIWATTFPKSYIKAGFSTLEIIPPSKKDKSFITKSIERLKTLETTFKEMSHSRLKDITDAIEKLEKIRSKHFSNHADNSWEKQSPEDYANWIGLKENSFKITEEAAKEIGKYFGELACKSKNNDASYFANLLSKRFNFSRTIRKYSKFLRVTFFEELKKCEAVFKKIPEATIRKFQKLIKDQDDKKQVSN